MKQTNEFFGLSRGIARDFLAGLFGRRKLEVLVTDFLISVAHADVSDLEGFHFFFLAFMMLGRLA